MTEFGPGRNAPRKDQSGQDDVLIEAADPLNPDFIEMVARHMEFAHATTPPENVYALDVDVLAGPNIDVFGLWIAGELAGIGALAVIGDASGELKSMHVAEQYRGRGLAARLLAHLIARARERGYGELWLETGSMEAYAPARRLYARFGFRECGPFGTYPDHPNSAFMHLDLRE